MCRGNNVILNLEIPLHLIEEASQGKQLIEWKGRQLYIDHMEISGDGDSLLANIKVGGSLNLDLFVNFTLNIDANDNVTTTVHDYSIENAGILNAAVKLFFSEEKLSRMISEKFTVALKKAEEMLFMKMNSLEDLPIQLLFDNKTLDILFLGHEQKSLHAQVSFKADGNIVIKELPADQAL